MTKDSVFRAPYLRNCTSYDRHLCYTSVKWCYLQAVFIFFQNFDFPVVSGWKGKIWPKMTKHYVCFTPYLRNRTSYDYGFWYTFAKWWYFQHFFFFFFHFFKILMNEKKTYNYQFQFVTLYISGTVNHIIKIFGTQV